MTKIVLASTSPYRKKLLEELGLTSINCIAPLDDEEQISTSEYSPQEVAEKRGHLKALSALNDLKNNVEKIDQIPTIIIGGDQLAFLPSENKVLGKPGSPEKAIEQLKTMNGNTHQLITSMTVLYYNNGENNSWVHTDITSITFKDLSSKQIQNYVQQENPIDCAGSYKIESKGLWLIKNIDSQDFTAIQGLPLIALTNILHSIDQNLLKT